MKDGGRKPKTYTKSITVLPVQTAADECEIHVVTSLINVQPVFDDVKVGIFLTLTVQNGGIVVALNQNYQICGEIQIAQIRKLIDCISKGNNYRARVMLSRPSVTIQRVK